MLLIYKQKLSEKNQDYLIGFLAAEVASSFEKNINKSLYSKVSCKINIIIEPT